MEFLTPEENLSNPHQPSVQRPSLLPTMEDSMIKRYTRVFRAADAAMYKLFDDVQLLTEEGALIKVPIVYGSQERAVAAMFGKSITSSGDTVRIKLPMMAISSIGLDVDRERYTYHEAVEYGVFSARKEFSPFDTQWGASRGIPVNRMYSLLIWTKFNEDAQQILEQVILKFSPVAYVSVAGAYWENIVTLDGLSNNLTYEVADNDLRVIKHEVTMTLQTYVPQPFRRTRTAKEVNVEFDVQPTNPEDRPMGTDLFETQTESVKVSSNE